MNRLLRCLFLLAGSLAWSALPAAEPVAETRAVLRQWLEARRQVAEQERDWTVQRELLRQTIGLLEAEQRLLDQQIAGFQDAASAADGERQAFEERLALLGTSAAAAEQELMGLERRLADLLPRLPQPLQEQLLPLQRRLPVDGVASRLSLAERAQTVVGLLNEIDKFNQLISVHRLVRPLADGRELSVQAVYLGLGRAYFIDGSGTRAGYGVPGLAGWEWVDQPELAPAVTALLRVYQNAEPARFVPLPAEVE